MIKIYNTATEEEVAIILTTVGVLEKSENQKKTKLSQWKKNSRKEIYSRNKWECEASSLWKLESKNLD